MSLAPYIDHSMLKADATEEVLARYCREAKENGFASVCVNSTNIPFVVRELAGSPVKACSVVGFPLGAMSSAAKAFEAKQAVANGAQEIDMVINLGAAKQGQWDRVEADIKAVVDAAKPALVKVIIECCLLTDAEKVRACQVAEKAGAAFVKTSTGFSAGGATIEDVKLMRACVGDRLGVKAAGGIRTPEFAQALLDAGASRLGAGDGMKLLNEEEHKDA